MSIENMNAVNRDVIFFTCFVADFVSLFEFIFNIRILQTDAGSECSVLQYKLISHLIHT